MSVDVTGVVAPVVLRLDVDRVVVELPVLRLVPGPLASPVGGRPQTSGHGRVETGPHTGFEFSSSRGSGNDGGGGWWVGAKTGNPNTTVRTLTGRRRESSSWVQTSGVGRSGTDAPSRVQSRNANERDRQGHRKTVKRLRWLENGRSPNHKGDGVHRG